MSDVQGFPKEVSSTVGQVTILIQNEEEKK
jgi:hypothetical protein